MELSFLGRTYKFFILVLMTQLVPSSLQLVQGVLFCITSHRTFRARQCRHAVRARCFGPIGPAGRILPLTEQSDLIFRSDSIGVAVLE